jgi:methylated-DNA-[protein]-cysteine S-methyltransferase
MNVFTTHPSPIGELTLVGDGAALTGVYMTSHRHRPPLPAGALRDDAPFAQARTQLDEYFAGARTGFDLPLQMEGTPFQLTVWRALLDIDYGQTESYGELARRIGRPDASRAVGLANGRNPLSIVVPCHRVIGASGSLTGYGGGVERKRFLLDLEAGAAELSFFPARQKVPA